MEDTPADRPVLGPTAQTLLRILIASYFLAGAVGIIPSSTLTPLTKWFLPEIIAGPIAAATVFVLSYLVMVGICLRGAALLLGILTFWASYLRMLELGLATELGSFWRDLALIASLMLTYSKSAVVVESAAAPQPLKILLHVRTRPVDAEQPVTPQEVAAVNMYQPYHPTEGHEKLSIEELEDIFQEDFRIARSG